VRTSWRAAVVQLISSPSWKLQHHANEDLRLLVRQTPQQFYGVDPQADVIARRLASHPHEATKEVLLYKVPSYHATGDTFGTLVMGARVSVCWEDTWVEGNVAACWSQPTSHDNAEICVHHDDDDIVWIKLFGEIFGPGDLVPPIRWLCPSLQQVDGSVQAPNVLPIHEAIAMHSKFQGDTTHRFLDPRVVRLLLEHHNAHREASSYWRRDEADEGDPRARMREGLAALAERLHHQDLASSIRAMGHVIDDV